MNLQIACGVMMSWLRDIQKFDPTFNAYGNAYPEVESKWDSRIHTLLYTGFGSIPNPVWRQSESTEKPTLTSKFTDILEARFCRRTYQDGLSRLEKALQAATEKYGEGVVAALTDRPEIKLWGEAFIGGLQKAGFVFENPEFLDRMLRKAQQTIVARDAEPAAGRCRVEALPMRPTHLIAPAREDQKPEPGR